MQPCQVFIFKLLTMYPSFLCYNFTTLLNPNRQYLIYYMGETNFIGSMIGVHHMFLYWLFWIFMAYILKNLRCIVYINSKYWYNLRLFLILKTIWCWKNQIKTETCRHNVFNVYLKLFPWLFLIIHVITEQSYIRNGD